MGSSLGSYQIARSGMFVNERGLYVTGQNLSNATTTGYVRQQSISETSIYTNVYKYQIGQGTDVQETRQIRNTFLDNVYRQENSTLGYAQTRYDTYGDIETILGEPMSDGLQSVMNKFWDSWQQLSTDPSSLTIKALVRQRASVLVDEVNQLGTQLDSLQNDLNTKIKTQIDQVNTITSQVAQLNEKILKAEANGDNANDYRDQRNTLLDQLSSIADIDVAENQDHMVDVTLNGYYLVCDNESTKLTAALDSSTGSFYVPKMEDSNEVVPINGGTLKGLLESRGEVKGALGSTSNGTPYAKEDITFVIDNSSTSSANIAKIQANIDKYIDELNESGIDYNLNLVTYDGSGAPVVGSYGSNYTAFKNAVEDPSLIATASTGNDFNAVVTTLNGMTYRTDAQKYAIVFTGESIDGDGVTASDIATPAEITNYLKTLSDKGIKTSVVTGSSYFSQGNGGSEAGWSSVTQGTGGRIYDINSSDFGSLMSRIGLDNADDGISNVQSSLNIIPDLKKKLNALINTLCREVNSLQRSGKTPVINPSTGTYDGGDIFVATNSSRPMEMGNISLNTNILSDSGLNLIVTSTTGDVGNNDIAKAIADLRYKSVLNDSGNILSLDDYYNSIINGVGNDGEAANTTTKGQTSLVESIDSSRQSVSSVSSDEEMSNMIKYQYAYSASARALNVIDQMVETLISKMGLAGR